MIRVSVFYPASSGVKFDHAYYSGTHMAMVKDRLGSKGLVKAEVDRGLAGGAPGAPAPFVAAGHLYFASIEEFQSAFSAHSAEIMADIPNYTDIEPQIQISEIVA
jgi:uncharacterized protein (TIGR02118 family)